MLETPFITGTFLLSCPAAERLYFDFAAPQPIIDYHCHLPPAEIASDRRFANLAEIWLHGDHYKWRAMRANGVPERLCTGDATDREKFQAFAETVPRTLRNPLYHWTHMELSKPFGITGRLLDGATAQSIWDECNASLAEPGMTTRGILRQFNVVLVCTTDDPADDLAAHQQIAADATFPVQVLPTFRADKAMAVDDAAAWNAYVDRLGKAADVDIFSWPLFLDALRRRQQAFHDAGCRLSDHGLEEIPCEDATETVVNSLFARLRDNKGLGADEARLFKSAVLHELALMDHERGWTQQFHLGALRNNNTRLHRKLGPDTGFDSIGDFRHARALSRFLDRLDSKDRLARTILYNLNPSDNEVFATMIGNFQDGSVPGKMQFGSGWWFLDQLDGMTRQMNALSSMGLLSRFVGMLTDSRSFLSYPRHDYFRRLLCDLLGREMQAGLLPMDFDLVGGLVRDVSYGNAREYFGFEGLPPVA